MYKCPLVTQRSACLSCGYDRFTGCRLAAHGPIGAGSRANARSVVEAFVRREQIDDRADACGGGVLEQKVAGGHRVEPGAGESPCGGLAGSTADQCAG